MVIINQILLVKIAEIVIIKINLGIEFSISIPLEHKNINRYTTSSFSFPTLEATNES